MALVLLLYIYRRSKQTVYGWFRPQEVAGYRPFLKVSLRVLGLALVLTSLLGPYWGKKEQDVNLLGKEVYIVLDVSASMNVEDLKPTRLDKAKRELHGLIDALKGNPVGLIVYAKHAYVQCPLTYDHKLLHTFLDLAETAQFAETGTEIRSGLNLCLERFVHVEKRNKRTSRAVVLVTDGEDFGDTYSSVLERFKKQEIQLFVVGVGTSQGGTIPEIVQGKVRGHKTAKDGTIALSALKTESLKLLTERFNTDLYLLDKASATLKSLIEDIENLNASPISVRSQKVENSKYQWFLGVGLLCLFLSMCLLPMGRNPI